MAIDQCVALATPPAERMGSETQSFDAEFAGLVVERQKLLGNPVVELLPKVEQMSTDCLVVKFA
ncbi:hypothetical protein B0H19DRAFT_1156767 [Mycena capillaripes]|nr:hypothetical protein B0H19DRAFT_1156767 [Mycena capillaripes]